MNAKGYKNKQHGYWTEEKQQELYDMMTAENRKSYSAIAKHFDRPRHIIFIVFSSIVKRKAFYEETYYENGVKIIKYKPGGVKPASYTAVGYTKDYR